jgi:hypothetical protein
MKTIIKQTTLKNSVLAGTLMLLPFLASTSFAGPHVMPVNGNPFGQSYKEWAIDFARWSMSIPYGSNPAFNPAVANCTLPQHGKVWFVAGGADESACVVPNGKAIFVHMGAYIDDYPCPVPPPPGVPFEPAPGQNLEEFLTLDAEAVVDFQTETQHKYPNELYIDDKPVVDKTMLPKLRLSSGLFNFTGDLSLLAVDPCVTGTQQQAVINGYFALIEGLGTGKHKFEFRNSYTGEWGVTMQVTIGKDK